MITAAAMLPREGRQWGDRNDDDGEEEVVEVRWTTTMRPPRRREVAAGKRAGSRSPQGGRRMGAVTTWRCCTGGGWTSAMPTPTASMRWRGVVIDKLIPSLFSVDIIIFTSTKSEHSDSPWCEPINPLFSEIV